MISRNPTIHWQNFMYMDVRSIKEFCDKNDINIQNDIPNSFKEKKELWKNINIYRSGTKPNRSTKEQARKKPDIISELIKNNISYFTDKSLSNIECSKKLGLNLYTLIKYRKMHGIKVKDGRKKNSITFSKLCEEQKKYILDGKISTRECCSRTGLSQWLVMKIRKQLNVHINRKKNTNNSGIKPYSSDELEILSNIKIPNGICAEKIGRTKGQVCTKRYRVRQLSLNEKISVQSAYEKLINEAICREQNTKSKQ